MKTKSLIFLLLFTFTHAISNAQTQWEVTNYYINFTIKNMGINVEGNFSGLESTINFSPDCLSSSKITASILTHTIDTGIGLRDKHLKKSAYFDVDQYPEIKMESEYFKKSAEGYLGKFLLTIKGKTKSVTIPFEFDEEGTTARLHGRFSINRRDFSIGKNHMTMGDEVDIQISLDVNNQNIALRD